MNNRIRHTKTFAYSMILGIAALMINQVSYAQIVITKNSFDSFLNSSFTLTSSSSSDTTNILPLFLLSGPNQTWDFTTLEYDFEAVGSGTIRTFSTTSGTPGDGDDHFEQASHIIRAEFTVDFYDEDDEEQVSLTFINYEYTIINDEEFISLGSISLEPDDPEEDENIEFVVYNRPGEIDFKFPATYESEWSYEFEQVFDLDDEFDVGQDYEVNVVIDGWGQLVTNHGTFEVLRIKKTKKLDFGFFEFISVEVDFVTSGGFQVASIEADVIPFSDEIDVESLEASVTGFNTGTSNPREIVSELPDRVMLHQNYPNPFNPSTIIAYELPDATTVTLDIYTVTGVRVMPVISERYQQAGRHAVTVDASGLASGVYIYRLRTDNQVVTRKMTLIK